MATEQVMTWINKEIKLSKVSTDLIRTAADKASLGGQLF